MMMIRRDDDKRGCQHYNRACEYQYGSLDGGWLADGLPTHDEVS